MNYPGPVGISEIKRIDKNGNNNNFLAINFSI